MQNVDALNSRDFYFNGRWLSELGGEVAGESGNSPLSLIPQMDIKSEKVLGRHGEIVYGGSYNPRTFTVPVLFNDIRRIREIASWLNTNLQPKTFYYKNDTVKIDCMIDSVLDLKDYCYQGVVELKFIAHYPFFKSTNDRLYVIQKDTIDSTSTIGNTTTIKRINLSNISITNDGNKESFPIYKIVGKGKVIVVLNGVEIFFVDLNTVADESITIDTFNCSAYDGFINKINKFEGEYAVLPNGSNIITVTGTCTKIEIQCRSEWI